MLGGCGAVAGLGRCAAQGRGPGVRSLVRLPGIPSPARLGSVGCGHDRLRGARVGGVPGRGTALAAALRRSLVPQTALVAGQVEHGLPALRFLRTRDFPDAGAPRRVHASKVVITASPPPVWWESSLATRVTVNWLGDAAVWKVSPNSPSNPEHQAPSTE